MEYIEKPNCPPPEGYQIKANGYIDRYDYIWDRVAERWALVYGIREIAIGAEISPGGIVARRENANHR